MDETWWDDHYKLDEDNNPIPIAGPEEVGWRRNGRPCPFGVEGCPLHVGRDFVGGTEISTVFLEIDHGSGGRSYRPTLFETMIFGGALDQQGDRYSTWAEAAAGHRRWVKRVKKAGDGQM